MDPDIKLVLDSIEKAGRKESNFVEEGYDIPGLSSNIVRHFLNNLCSKEDAVYLELGVHAGSTFVAATMNNDLTAFCVDDYSESNIAPFREKDAWDAGNKVIGHEGYKVDNPKNTLLRSLKPNQIFLPLTIQKLSESHFNGKKCNVIFYDADHDAQQQYDNLTYLYTIMDDQFIIVIDDANFMGVVESANIWIKENDIKVLFDRKILSSVPEDPNGWWNGVHIMVCKK